MPISIQKSDTDRPSISAVNRRSVPWRAVTFLYSKLGVGACILGLLLIVAVFGPVLAPYAYDQMNMSSRLASPSAAHWFGTDEYGRDVFSRILVGARLSLAMGFCATLVSLVLGVPLGLLAGFKRRRFDEIVMRAMDVLMSVPPIMLGLLILAVTPPALWKAILAVGLVYVPPIVRITRSVTLDLVNEDFIEAARARGEKTWFILARELLPNAWPAIAVEGSLRVTFAILLGAALSFLGMGAQPPSSEWGLMISDARPILWQAPWVALAPGLAMCFTVIGINLLGDGLRELLDPRMKNR